jgi:hypothetical protein
MDKHSGSMPLSKFISEYKDHLPQAIEVTVGKEDTVQGGISSGEILIACFLKSTRVVKTHLHRLNCAVSLPINSKLRFALLPDNCKPLDPSKSYPWECEVNSVAQLLKMDCLPKAVKVMKQCQSHASKVLSKKHVVSSGTILLNLKKTTIRSGLGMKNGIKCTSGHGVVHFFTETDQVSFHTYRQSVHMPVYEFFEHMRYPVTGEVHLVSEVNESISLQTGDRVTFLCAEEETMLVLKNHHTDLPEVPICSVPCDLDIEVKCVSLESEGNVYEDIKECKKMIRNASNTHIGVPEPGLHSYVDMNVLGVASRELRRLETPCPRNMVKHLVKCYENKGSDPDPVKRFKKISIKSQSLELLPTTYENVEGTHAWVDKPCFPIVQHVSCARSHQ